jgi:hypothetical protein
MSAFRPSSTGGGETGGSGDGRRGEPGQRRETGGVPRGVAPAWGRVREASIFSEALSGSLQVIFSRGVTTPFVASYWPPIGRGFALFDVGQASLSGFDSERGGLMGQSEVVTGVGES